MNVEQYEHSTLVDTRGPVIEASPDGKKAEQVKGFRSTMGSHENECNNDHGYSKKTLDADGSSGESDSEPLNRENTSLLSKMFAITYQGLTSGRAHSKSHEGADARSYDLENQRPAKHEKASEQKEQHKSMNDSINTERLKSVTRKFERKEYEWAVQASKYEEQIAQLKNSGVDQVRLERENVLLETQNRELHDQVRESMASLKESKIKYQALHEENEQFILAQQAKTFHHVDLARWQPMDEGKVMEDLDRLKRDIRTWAKSIAVKEFAPPTEELVQMLKDVMVLENEQLPPGLKGAVKLPMVLLSALLAQHVFAHFFFNPFVFFKLREHRVAFHALYQRLKVGKEQDAHAWRAQTLRALLPPLRSDTTEAESKLHHETDALISKAATKYSLRFATSAAKHLMNDMNEESFSKLVKIYDDAAVLSNRLWAQKTDMKYFTLGMLDDTLYFNAENPYLEPDRLVQYEDHEDHLEEKKVAVLMHPVLLAYGNDEGKDYDKGRVWAKGVVWLDSCRRVS